MSQEQLRRAPQRIVDCDDAGLALTQDLIDEAKTALATQPDHFPESGKMMKPDLSGFDAFDVLKQGRQARATQPEQAKGGEPLFWYRPCPNGLYEGPLHNKSIEDVRKRSGAWVPLYPHHPAPAASAEREARVIEQNARKAAQEQLYAERERHTAQANKEGA